MVKRPGVVTGGTRGGRGSSGGVAWSVVMLMVVHHLVALTLGKKDYRWVEVHSDIAVWW